MNLLIYLFFRGWLLLTELIPVRLARFKGKWLGNIAWALNQGPRRITEENLRICFPDMPEAERTDLAKRHLQQLGMALMEMGLAWQTSQKRVLKHVRQVTGKEHIDAAIAHGKGVIVLGPHIGNWEVLGLYLATLMPVTNMYQPPDQPWLDAVIRRGRERSGADLVPTNTTGVKAQLRALKRGEMVGVLPDQVPPLNSGKFAPFFGTPALTATMAYNLIRRTGARAVFAFAKRIPHSGDFEVIFIPADEELYSEDEVTALTALNRGVEATIAVAPEQYQWEYKRFKRRPEGEQKFYLNK